MSASTGWADLSVNERAEILGQRLGGLLVQTGRRWNRFPPPSYFLLDFPFGEYETVFVDPAKGMEIVAILHEEMFPLALNFRFLRAHEFAAANGLGCMTLDSQTHGVFEPGSSVSVLYWRKDWKANLGGDFASVEPISSPGPVVTVTTGSNRITGAIWSVYSSGENVCCHRYGAEVILVPGSWAGPELGELIACLQVAKDHAASFVGGVLQ